MPPTLHMHLLGDFSLVAGEAPVTTGVVPRLQSLLAYLVLHSGAPQDRSHLAFLLWPDSTEAQAHTNLRKLLHHLRQALPDADQFLRADKLSLQWLPANADTAWTLDVRGIEQALARAKQAEQRQDVPALRQALEQVMSLYRGDLLPGCYDEWILPERDHFRQLFLSAAERLLVLLEQERDYDSAIAAAQQLLRHDPLHEATYRQLMRLYALRGNRAAALRIYHTCVTLLERELGAEPGASTRAVYESLLQSDTANTPNTPTKTPTGSLESRGTMPPLIGRKAEWRQLQDAWRKAVNGQSQVVLLSGEAGIGKTRLAEEMEAWVNRQGMTTATAHCYAAGRELAYAPVTEWLRTEPFQASLSTLDSAWLTEAARLLPELLIKRPKLPHPAPLVEGWQRQHFFEALARAALNARQPVLLLLDDLQWCDDETLTWLHYLLRFDVGARVMLLCTVRSEETLSEQALRTFLGAVQREGRVTEIALKPLDTLETTALAGHLLRYQPDTAMLDTLYRETEGNPLFVVEMVRAGTLEQHAMENPVVTSAPILPSLLTQASSTLPPTVQGVLSTRLAQLSPLARAVSNVAAVIGREFTFSVLAHASKENEDEVVQGLDELWQRRIVREQSAGMAETYDFSHDKLREMAYNSLSLAHRRLLHRRVAESLVTVYAEQLDSVSGQIAAHYERAGQSEQAIPYYCRAGEAALRIYANTEAVAAFERATALIAAMPTGSTWQKQQWETVVRVSMSLGDIAALTGRQPQASDFYQQALSHMPPQEYIWRARLLRKTASALRYASDNPMDTFHVNAQHVLQEAERILEQTEDRENSAWRQEWIQLQLDQLFPLQGSVDKMTAIIEKAQPVIEAYGTPEQQGKFFQAIIARDSKRDHYTASAESLANRRKSLAALEQTGNKDLIGFAHFVLGNGLLLANQLEEAEEQMHMALRLAREIGSTPLLMRSLTFLSIILRRGGQVAAMREVLSNAEARGSAIIKGHRAWIAWRDGNLAEAETYGQASLEDEKDGQGRQRDNAFRWTGVWPVMGVMLTQGKLAEAIDCVRVLLDPSQQPPDEAIAIPLNAALQAWDAGQQEEAHKLLQEVMPVAEKAGYL